jgi:hypothetical protein
MSRAKTYVSRNTLPQVFVLSSQADGSCPQLHAYWNTSHVTPPMEFRPTRPFTMMRSDEVMNSSTS